MVTIGVVGLGRMGNAVVQRLCRAGHKVFVYDINESAVRAACALGARAVHSLSELAHQVRVVWLKLPAGILVDKACDELCVAYQAQNVVDALIVDGGNSHYLDSQRRAVYCAARGVSFVDCGTSGGVHGREVGFCLMMGGDRLQVERLTPILEALAAPYGYAHCGTSGAGHYVKMVHNGIEYALLQSYAEGFQVLKEGAYPDLDLAKITGVWQHGSIIRSWINHLAHQVFVEHGQEFPDIAGVIGGGQTGTWTLEEARTRNISVPMIEQSLLVRDWSRRTGGNYATTLVALLRNAFGGHTFENKK
jgi:6-phosphogluconate dehydrogenase